jgi:hypothetical protein
VDYHFDAAVGAPFAWIVLAVEVYAFSVEMLRDFGFK